MNKITKKFKQQRTANARKWKHLNGGILRGIFLDPIANTLRLYYGNSYADSLRVNINKFVLDNPTFFQPYKDDMLRMVSLLQPTRRGKFITPYNNQLKKYIEDIYKYMTDKGYTSRQVSAIMGNIMQESSWDPAIKQRDGDKAEGLFLMHGDLLKAYKQYLAKTGKQDNLYSPIDYVLDLINETRDDKGNILAPHLYTKEYYRVINLEQTPEVKKYREDTYGERERTNTLHLLPELQTAWNSEKVPLDELTMTFTNVFERPGKSEHKSRVKYANEYYNYFNPE